MWEIVRRVIGLAVFIAAVLVSPTYLPSVGSVIIALGGLFLVTNIVTRQ